MAIETICDVMWEYHASNLPCSMDDLAEVIKEARQPGPSRYAEEEITGIFRLKDGRYLYVTGGCDTTGWDCQSGAIGQIRDTLEQIVVECCTDDDRKLLGLELPKAVSEENGT